MSSAEILSDDYYSPWKEAIEHYFPEHTGSQAEAWEPVQLICCCRLANEAARMVRQPGLA